MTASWLARWLVALAVSAVVAGPAAAQTQPDRQALLRLADEAAARGLPPAPVANKVREGLAKGVRPALIETVARQITANLEAADRLVREFEPSAAGAPRDAAVILLGESLGGGVTPDEIRELRANGLKDPAAGSIEPLASAARGLASIKDARLPADDGRSVMVEALRRGYRGYEMLDLGREIKRREVDYRAGRASLAALRDAIARGDRPEQLFTDTRPALKPAERPSRPEPTIERPVRPERAQPAERPQRPETPPQRNR